MTEIGNEFSHNEPLWNIMPVRYGVDEVWVDNGAYGASILPKGIFRKALTVQ